MQLQCIKTVSLKVNTLLPIVYVCEQTMCPIALINMSML